MRRYLPILLGLVVGTICVRLGMWQLDRLGQRRAFNAERASRARLPTLLFGSDTAVRTSPLGSDTLAFRRVVARGGFEFAGEQLETARSYRGAPGVYVLTPLRLADGTGVVVNRGWAYAPDGRTVDRATLVERESTTVIGVVMPRRGDARGLQPETLRESGRLFPLIVRRTGPPDSLPPGLAVLDVPPADNGPHLSYAIQWFAFATIAVVGSMVLVSRQGVEGSRRESKRVEEG